MSDVVLDTSGLQSVPIPANYLAALIIAIVVTFGGAIRHYVRTRSPLRIRIFGVSRTGKTTLNQQLETPSVSSAIPTSTVRLMPARNITYNPEPGNDEMARNLNLRDVVGHGWIDGSWYNVLIHDAPQGILFLIDQRAVMSGRLGTAMEDNQLAAFGYVVSTLTSKAYRDIVPPELRPKVFVLGVNKADAWDGEMDEAEIVAPFMPSLAVLQADGIRTHTCRLRANHRDFTKETMSLVMDDIEFQRRPWSDWFAYIRSGLRAEVIQAERQIKRLSRPPRRTLRARR